MIYDITIIGGGIVGLSTAYKISREYPDLKILLIEKESMLASHQTGRNSGVIHSGIYYKPGSSKARYCVEGRKELVNFAKLHNIQHDICGKIVVANNSSELPFLEKIYENGIGNNVEGIEYINNEQIKEIEPFCEGVKALWVPCTGIIDFKAVSFKLAEIFTSFNRFNKVITSCEVNKFVNDVDNLNILTGKGNFKTSFIINCTGLHSDRIARKEGTQTDIRIVGFRGDYFELTENAKHKVKNLIYPVPNPAFPFLGVHFTRMINGDIECGPNAVFVFKREGYKKSDFNIKDSWDALSYKGTWKLFGKHWKFGFDEYKRAFSKYLFLRRLRKLVPSLQKSDLKKGRSGVRAMALDKNGSMIEDFKIIQSNRAIHVINAPSPAATSGLAIGNAIKDMAEANFKLKS